MCNVFDFCTFVASFPPPPWQTETLPGDMMTGSCIHTVTSLHAADAKPAGFTRCSGRHKLEVRTQRNVFIKSTVRCWASISVAAFVPTRLSHNALPASRRCSCSGPSVCRTDRRSRIHTAAGSPPRIVLMHILRHRDKSWSHPATSDTKSDNILVLWFSELQEGLTRSARFQQIRLQ